MALLGRNGVGKTTLIHSIIGFRPIRSGSILFEGREIGGMPAHHIARMGIGLVPQGRRIFSSLTVLENLEIPYGAGQGGPGHFDTEKIFQTFPALRQRKRPPGQQALRRRAADARHGRALMMSPKLLLMDEPSEGLAPLLVREMGEIIRRLMGQGLTILLVEQKLSFVREVADYAYVMSKGKVVYHGLPEELWQNEEVKARHLGV